jgi:hypothetical protein
MTIMLKKEDEVAPGIFVIDGVLKNCEKYINTALSSNKWRDSKIKNPYRQDEFVNKEYRNNRILDIFEGPSEPSEWTEITKLIWLYGDEYGKYFNVGFSGMEYIQLLHYQGKNNFYKPYFDDGTENPRIFSALLYLNEVSNGGETHFINFNISVKPKPGRIVLFPANFIYLHEARPPIDEEKFVFATWFLR